MITVIKHGNRKTITCEECGCLFSYEADDIKKTEESYDKFGFEYSCFVECPQCKNTCFIKTTRFENDRAYVKSAFVE